MIEVYCVRADFGTFTKHFIKGQYVAIGWLDDTDLSGVKSKEELYPLYKKAHPDDTSNIVIGQQVGQIARFLFDIQPGDYVITPDADTELLYVGVMQPSPAYFFDKGGDGCRFHHRRPVKWLFADHVHLVAGRILLMLRGHAHIYCGAVRPALFVGPAHVICFGIVSSFLRCLRPEAGRHFP